MTCELLQKGGIFMILSCQNVSKSFGTDEILKNISFHIEDHEKAAIVGINGAGKSTLLKIITGELTADEGQVVLSKGRTMGYLSQQSGVKQKTKEQKEEHDRRKCDQISFLHNSWHIDLSLLLYFFADGFSEQAGGTHQKDDDQDHIGHCFISAGQHVYLDQIFDDAQQEAACHGAGNASDPAEDRCHKGFQAQRDAQLIFDAHVRGGVHHGRDCGQAGTDGKGDGDDLIDVDPHKRRCRFVLGNSPHGFSELGVFDKQGQDKHDNDADSQCQQRLSGYAGAEQGDRRQGKHGRYVSRRRAEEHQGSVLQNKAHAQSCDEGCGGALSPHRLVSDLFCQNADENAHNDSREYGEPGRKSQAVHNRDGIEQSKTAYHDEIAVGEIDHPNDSIYHSIAEGCQRVYGAQIQSVHQTLYQSGHNFHRFL